MQVNQGEIMTVVEAAELLDVEPTLVRRWIREKRLPAKRIGERLYVLERKHVEAWDRLDRKPGRRATLPEKK
jgi:excisionase family DNA binding protein